MSSSGDSKAEIAQARALGRLETVVARLLVERRKAAERVQKAEKRVADLEARMAASAADNGDPVELKKAISRLEAEKTELIGRMETGREGVDRLLSRIRFLKDQRSS